jgi:hypothetical protein
VREVFGAKALIQRCTLHKRRNVAEHLPDKDKAWVEAKLVKALVIPTGLHGIEYVDLLNGHSERVALKHRAVPDAAGRS